MTSSTTVQNDKSRSSPYQKVYSSLLKIWEAFNSIAPEGKKRVPKDGIKPSFEELMTLMNKMKSPYARKIFWLQTKLTLPGFESDAEQFEAEMKQGIERETNVQDGSGLEDISDDDDNVEEYMIFDKVSTPVSGNHNVKSSKLSKNVSEPTLLLDNIEKEPASSTSETTPKSILKSVATNLESSKKKKRISFHAQPIVHEIEKIVYKGNKVKEKLNIEEDGDQLMPPPPKKSSMNKRQQQSRKNNDCVLRSSQESSGDDSQPSTQEVFQDIHGFFDPNEPCSSKTLRKRKLPINPRSKGHQNSIDPDYVITSSQDSNDSASFPSTQEVENDILSLLDKPPCTSKSPLKLRTASLFNSSQSSHPIPKKSLKNIDRNTFFKPQTSSKKAPSSPKPVSTLKPVIKPPNEEIWRFEEWPKYKIYIKYGTLEREFLLNENQPDFGSDFFYHCPKCAELGKKTLAKASHKFCAPGVKVFADSEHHSDCIPCEWSWDD